jgi:c-di-GMP-binding flagellar brake protein YcgR
MGHIPERRGAQRVVVEPGHTIRFQADGQAFSQVRLGNISRTGCFAMLPGRDATRLADGAHLEALVFEHPELPSRPLRAEVVYLLGDGDDPSGEDLVGMGIRFQELDPDSAARLEAFIEERLEA